MGINEIIVWILMICMVLGGLDRAIGNRFGLGEKFEEGFNAMGPLALSMVGVYALSPVLAKLLSPIVSPIYRLMGADPAMFAGTLLAIDMGGVPLAEQMTENVQAQQLSGLILGSMMGATIVFTIPVALGIINESDRPFLAKGVLAGIITIPIGVICGGLFAGMDAGFVLRNTIPIIVAAALIAVGMALIPNGMTTGFLWFGKGLVFIISIGLIIGVFETMTGVAIMPPGWELLPVEEGIAIVGSIAMMLLGAFPAVHLIVTFGKKPLSAVGRMMGINEQSAGGLIATLANNIAMFEIMKNMDARGKIINAAFAVSAAFALGDHLGFVAGVQPDMIAPMVGGKLIAGITAVILAYFLFRNQFPSIAAQSAHPSEDGVIVDAEGNVVAVPADRLTGVEPDLSDAAQTGKTEVQVKED